MNARIKNYLILVQMLIITYISVDARDIKVTIFYNSKVAKVLLFEKHQAVTIYPFVFFAKSKGNVSKRTFAHEMVHVTQVKKLGWFKFYYAYLKECWKVGYKKNSFEVEARKISLKSKG